MNRPFFFMVLLMMAAAGTAFAETPVGTWLTGPDAKGQVAHVKVTPCGAAVCGTIVRAFDANGSPVMTPNVGKRIFWNMMPVASGKYEGRAYVPAHDREIAGKMNVAGRQLTVRGCIGPLCQKQVWSRVN